jgi:hypothetical protein
MYENCNNAVQKHLLIVRNKKTLARIDNIITTTNTQFLILDMCRYNKMSVAGSSGLKIMIRKLFDVASAATSAVAIKKYAIMIKLAIFCFI